MTGESSRNGRPLEPLRDYRLRREDAPDRTVRVTGVGDGIAYAVAHDDGERVVLEEPRELLAEDRLVPAGEDGDGGE